MSYDEHLISMAGGDGDGDVLGAIHARVEAATEGPWHVDGFGDVVRAGLPTDYIDTAGITQDSEFIAHARADIPALLAMVREQRAVIERVKRAVAAVDALKLDPAASTTPHCIEEYNGGLTNAIDYVRAALTTSDAS